MMRALIVDDEIYAREEMETLLKETGEFIVAGKCANALEAMQAIKQEKPDVLFLDVQMPVINGFELLSMIDAAAMPRVVFVTAYDEYALKAFEENALDYLLKPVEKERLAKTVEKLKKRFAEGGRPVFAGPEIQKIPCIHSSKIKLINTAEIEYVRSRRDGGACDLAGRRVLHGTHPPGPREQDEPRPVPQAVPDQHRPGGRDHPPRKHGCRHQDKIGPPCPREPEIPQDAQRKTALLRRPCVRGRRRLTGRIDRSTAIRPLGRFARTASPVAGCFSLTKRDCGY